MVKLSLMEKAWKSSKESIFRLEAIPEYAVPEDLVLFEKWKKGKLELEKASKEWLENLKKTKERGVKMQRVRIVPLPLSEYIKYEIDFWKYSIQNGEEMFFLEGNKYEELIQHLDFKPKDFWMFDDKVLIMFHYDGKGDFVKEEPISDKIIIKKHLELKRKLLPLAVPMITFLKTKSITKN